MSSSGEELWKDSQTFTWCALGQQHHNHNCVLDVYLEGGFAKTASLNLEPFLLEPFCVMVSKYIIHKSGELIDVALTP